MSAAARKAWRTRRRHGRSGFSKKQVRKAKARITMKKGRHIKIHSPNVKVNGHAKGTYAPPKRWWDQMTRQGHGPANKPLSAAAAGHLWFKVYNNSKRLQIVKEFG